jgi:N-acetyl-alpha-D-muramate 1-phosphate uridylyltransferase
VTESRGTPAGSGITPALCALMLAAGEGTRLRPLTEAVPKALCPVGNVALLDRALARLAQHNFSGPALVAVNACYRHEQISSHVGGRAFVSLEPGPPALGTAGAVANLRAWIAGRALLVGNADAYLAPGGGPAGQPPGGRDLTGLVDGWDGSTVRVLCVPADQIHEAEFGTRRFAGFSLLPWSVVETLPEGRSELVREVWRPAEQRGQLELVDYDGTYLDCGTPADYIAANLHAAAAGSIVAPDAVVPDSATLDRAVVGSGAEVLGRVTRSVVWPGGHVGPTEHVIDAVRVGHALTVPAAPA